MRDTSLDEFVGGDDADDERDGAGSDADGSDRDLAAGDGADDGAAGDGADDGAAGDEAADDGAAGESGAPAASGGAVDEADDGATPEPAVSTLDWTPTGAACGTCGSDVERRWREDGELVCADCKDW